MGWSAAFYRSPGLLASFLSQVGITMTLCSAAAELTPAQSCQRQAATVVTSSPHTPLKLVTHRSCMNQC